MSTPPPTSLISLKPPSPPSPLFCLLSSHSFPSRHLCALSHGSPPSPRRFVPPVLYLRLTVRCPFISDFQHSRPPTLPAAISPFLSLILALLVHPSPSLQVPLSSLLSIRLYSPLLSICPSPPRSPHLSLSPSLSLPGASAHMHTLISVPEGEGTRPLDAFSSFLFPLLSFLTSRAHWWARSIEPKGRSPSM